MIVVAGATGVASAPVVVAAVAYRIALFAAIPVLYIAARVWTSTRGDRPVATSDSSAPTSGPGVETPG
jgi:hypothetical protein